MLKNMFWQGFENKKHEIDSESGIIISSVKYTAGKDFCAEKVQEWFQKCEERKKHPKFNFVEV